MTDDLLKKLMECQTPYAEVWPGSEIWAPVARVEEVKEAVLGALDGVLRDSITARVAAMPADELRTKLTAAGEDPDGMVETARRVGDAAEAALRQRLEGKVGKAFFRPAGGETWEDLGDVHINRVSFSDEGEAA